jgi:hypothetical protein
MNRSDMNVGAKIAITAVAPFLAAGVAFVVVWLLAPLGFLWGIYKCWDELWRVPTPERLARAAKVQAEAAPYHLVPYAVEWGGSYYRKCYCDGSVCGAFPQKRELPQPKA